MDATPTSGPERGGSGGLLHGRHTAATGTCITVRQSGPIWNLSTNVTNSARATATCTIPHDRYVLVAAPAVDCSTVEPAPFRAHGNAQLKRCARHNYGRLARGWEYLVDGRGAYWAGGYEVPFGAFSFTMPASDNYLGVAGATRGRAAAYGAVLWLYPFAPGPHTITVKGFWHAPPAVRTTTYHLTVV